MDAESQNRRQVSDRETVSDDRPDASPGLKQAPSLLHAREANQPADAELADVAEPILNDGKADTDAPHARDRDPGSRIDQTPNNKIPDPVAEEPAQGENSETTDPHGADALHAEGLPEHSLIWRIRHAISRLFFSSVTKRILLLNLFALFALMSAILYLNQFRQSLIEARIESLVTQGRIIAGAISASASVETGDISIDPEALLRLKQGESVKPQLNTIDSLQFPIDPLKVAPVLRSLIEPTSTRARIYDPDGALMLDSRNIYSSGQVLRYELPNLEGGAQQEELGMVDRVGNFLSRLLERRDLPIYVEHQGSGLEYSEVVSALTGRLKPIVRMTEKGQQIVSVAVPIQRFRAVLGVLLLSTQAGDIDRKLAEERLIILRIFLVAGVVMVLLSVLLARTIAKPLGKLSEAAVRVRRGVRSRIEIPDFSDRPDEIGNLSQSLSDMTNALYARIDAIESFAADVSHELKNPLTSLRSAVETLPLARNPESQARLMEVIQHDVRRLDRLITDISDASRLDAELVRADAQSVDMAVLLKTIAGAASELSKRHKQVKVTFSQSPLTARQSYRVLGHESRLGQVVNNLIDNARSFVPEGSGQVDIALSRRGRHVITTITDNGPGIDKDNLERIFTRFYTDRPGGAETFGQNSGLGLSISRQIVEAHGGRIRASNRRDGKTGAVFTITLPAEQ